MEKQSDTSSDHPHSGEERKAKRGGAKLREEMEELRRAKEEAQSESEQMRDRWMRAVADLDNYKKRASRERDDFFKYANENVAREFLPILDNLQRALAHQKDGNDQRGFLEGIEMIERQFLAALEKMGVTPIQALNQPFDPSRHEAMLQVESGECEPNTVVQELERGYMLHDRLDRKSVV